MGAESPVDFDSRRRELRDYLGAFIDAHLHNRPEFFVQDISDDYVNVSRGELVRQTKPEILAGFTDHLGSTEFSEYRLLGEPEIGLSKDGSAAWSIFRLKVAGTRKMPDGTAAQFDAAWGCLVLFERRGVQPEAGLNEQAAEGTRSWPPRRRDANGRAHGLAGFARATCLAL